jgi:hypothetical protein
VLQVTFKSVEDGIGGRVVKLGNLGFYLIETAKVEEAMRMGRATGFGLVGPLMRKTHNGELNGWPIR